MKILFHTPTVLDPLSPVGCGIRPVKMLEAFKEMGCEVTVVAGTASDRKKIIKQVNAELKDGGFYDFCYSESPPLPTLLTEHHRFPTHPFLDFGFFANLQNRKIPISLFYRDIYWMVCPPPKEWGILKNSIANFFYLYDLKRYAHLVDLLYLPTEKMGDYIASIPKSKKKPLPPGAEIKISEKILKEGDSINLLYVGGLGDSYKMHELLKGLSDDVRFTLCTREKEWEKVKCEYDTLMGGNTNIVHKSGDDLDILYQNSDIAMLFMKPDDYREFAAPIKLFEYIGRGKPIIASKGTYAAKFVSDNNVGWSIDYNSKSLKDLITHLQNNPHEVLNAAKNCIKTSKSHSWAQRAQQVINDCRALKSSSIEMPSQRS